MKIVNVSMMRSIEKAANAAGWGYPDMMQAAGRGLAEIILSVYGYLESQTVVGLVGSGNNGGDTLVALGILAENGWKTHAYIARSRSETDNLVIQYLAAGGEVIHFRDDEDFHQLDGLLDEATVLVDGVLGTGFELPLKTPLDSLLGHIQKFKDLPYVVAVDCPSGVNCDTGEAAAESIPADITVCMAAVKQGLLAFPAFDLVGDIEVVDIGLPAGIVEWAAIQCQVVDENYVHQQLPDRSKNSHKGTFGTVMVMAGSVNYPGAAYLAGKAAYRSGAGLVRMAAPSPLHGALVGALPEATWLLLPHESGFIARSAAELVLRNLDKVTVLLMGPGWGVEESTLDCLRKLLGGQGSRVGQGNIGFLGGAQPETSPLSLPPLVIDADGLKLLAKVHKWTEILPAQSVLTPHPGEMAVLTGLSTEAIQADRLGIAEKYAREWNQVVVLKGALTVIASPTGEVRVIPVATSALAHAGTGDVLAGIIAALMAQGMEPFSAATCGAWIHAQAGLTAEEEVGHSASVLAGDVLEAIPAVLSWVW